VPTIGEVTVDSSSFGLCSPAEVAGLGHGRLHLHPRVTADAHGFLALGNLQFGDARLLQQLDQFFDFTNIHP
jgi:hypothetical protein